MMSLTVSVCISSINFNFLQEFSICFMVENDKIGSYLSTYFIHSCHVIFKNNFFIFLGRIIGLWGFSNCHRSPSIFPVDLLKKFFRVSGLVKFKRMLFRRWLYLCMWYCRLGSQGGSVWRVSYRPEEWEEISYIKGHGMLFENLSLWFIMILW